MMLTIIFSMLPFFVALCWLVVYIIDYREHKRDKKLFAYLLGTLAALYFTHATYYLDERELFGVLESLSAYCYLAVYPLSFLYIKALTDPRPLISRNFHIMVIPAVVFIWSVACYAAMGSDRQIFIDHYFFHEGPAPEMTAAVFLQIARLSVSRIFFGLQMILVIIYGNRNLTSFRKKVSDFYSNVDGHDLRSIRLFIRILWGYSAVALIASIAGRSFFSSSQGMLVCSSLIFSSLLYCMCYAVRKEDFSADRFEEDVTSHSSSPAAAPASNTDTPSAPEESEALAASAAGRDGETSESSPAAGASNAESKPDPSATDHYGWIGPALDALMTSKEVFRNDELLITDVARMIGSNRTYVSTYLNKEKGMSFSEYINGYRIEYAKHLLDTDSRMNLAEISERSGFSSEASFYRVFKRLTGKTPNGYRSSRQ